MTRDAEHTPSPQSVVVPVEPTEDMMLAGALVGPDTNNGQFGYDDARTVFVAMLAAAPAPSSLAGEDGSFRGAEWFGVTGAADETEALAVALFDARCPGIRMIDEDLHYYRAAAQRAMQAVADELDTPALTPRHEAPACSTCGGKGYTEHEGGDGEGHPSRPEIEDCPKCHEAPAEGAGEALKPYISLINSTPDLLSLLYDADMLPEQTVTMRGAVSVAAVCEAYQAGLRARSSAPEAREGEVVGWLWRSQGGTVKLTTWHPDTQAESAERLYTRPAAPSADKLRIDLWWNAEDWETTFDNIEDAYEAATGGYCVGVARLGRATEHDAVWAAMIDIDTTGDGEADDREIRLFATEDEARQALANQGADQ